MSDFVWSEKTTQAAIALAAGQTVVQVSDIAKVTERTVYRWLNVPEFSEEVDRLTFLTGIANKAERLRLAKRVIVKLGTNTNKDLLEWLKFAQSETDGVKLDLTGLSAALGANGASLAGSGQGGTGAPDESEGRA